MNTSSSLNLTIMHNVLASTRLSSESLSKNYPLKKQDALQCTLDRLTKVARFPRGEGWHSSPAHFSKVVGQKASDFMDEG